MAHMKIAICDDDVQEAGRLAAHIDSCYDEALITTFSDPSVFAHQTRFGMWDAVFMDIYMPTSDGGEDEVPRGIEAIEGLRKVDPLVPVVMVTRSTDHALEGFRLGVSQYLVKPVAKKEVRRALEAIQRERLTWAALVVRSERKEVPVFPREIVYAQQRGHYSNIRLVDGSMLSTRMGLDEIEAGLGRIKPVGLGGARFYRIHKSYLVNLTYVQHVMQRTSELRLSSGEVVPVRRGLASQVEEAWTKWMFDRTKMNVTWGKPEAAHAAREPVGAIPFSSLAEG